MPHMIIRKRRHREITMIIPLLEPNPYTTISLLRRRLLEILGEQLALVVEVVGCALPIIINITSPEGQSPIASETLAWETVGHETGRREGGRGAADVPHRSVCQGVHDSIS